ncbi:TatD family hydrolase [Candidatus Micrarchaeota archaeon]|nr:TatD family hydrolase [Candidatus Micrarchaeota archaeon]
MIIDSHVHLDSFKPLVIPDDILPVGVGYSHKSNQAVYEICREKNLPYVLGIAPQTSIIEGLGGLEEWIEFIRKAEPNAVGEVGLDFHWSKTDEHIKNEYFLFDRMIELSKELDVPLVIHSRKAEKECLDMLEERGIRKFLMHYFAGDIGLAERAVDMGGLISIPPVHSKKRREVIKNTDLKFLLVETDAPYVAKKIDDVKKAVEYISEVKGVSFEETAEKTSENASVFFGIE